MDETFYTQFQSCTVRLETETSRGTGFFIAPRTILTCAHVVKESHNIKIYWGERILSPLEIDTEFNIDIAILTIELDKHPCVCLDSEVLPGDKLYSYGYPEPREKRDGNSLTVEYVGTADKGRSLIIKGENVRSGFSGAPLLNQRTSKVCGLIKKDRRLANLQNRCLGGYAIPIQTVFQHCSKFKNKNHHLVTNSEYRKFIKQTNYRRPPHWKQFNPFFAEEQNNSPVTHISWDDALAYCDWFNGSLPRYLLKDLFEENNLIHEINHHLLYEWREAGIDDQKYISSVLNAQELFSLDRITRRKNIGFRCVSTLSCEPRKWVYIDEGNYALGTDIQEFKKMAIKHDLTYSDSNYRAILSRNIRDCQLSSYQISANTVSNEEYYAFTKHFGAKWPSHWNARWLEVSGFPFPQRLAHKPVVNVNAEQAQSYCMWSGTRLPTWKEWERAASGPTKSSYPWGDRFYPNFCNSRESGRGLLAYACEYPSGDSFEEIRQLCGNVEEWVTGEKGKYERRGGSFLLDCELWGLTYVFREAYATLCSQDLGFRVVYDL